MTSGRPYQGYPYVNPVVIEAPSLSPSQIAALNRWKDLPTKRITTQPPGQRHPVLHKIDEQTKYYIDPKTDGSKNNIYPHYPTTKRTPKYNDHEQEPQPAIYIDLPEDGFSGSSVSEDASCATGASSSRATHSTNRFNNTNDVNSTREISNASVFNDSTNTNENSPNGRNRTNWEIIRVTGNNSENVKNSKDETSSLYEDNDEIEPVVYIDIPETNESDVSQRLAVPERELDYAEQTIYYNPFKENKSESREEEAATTPQPGPSQRPWPPNSLNITSPVWSSNTVEIPSFLSKEAYVYGRHPTPDDDFSLSPIPLTHQPPPSYEESARTVSPQSPEIRPDPKPPRTQVITHNPERQVVGQADLERQLLYCQHCSKQVNTLVVRETGVLTHFIACMFMLVGLFPLTIAVYFLNTFKYRNHYCPNCNKKIGYEIPFLCRGMKYVYKE